MRARLLAVLRARLDALSREHNTVAPCPVDGYPDLVCAGAAGHPGPHWNRAGWHWTDTDAAWRETPNAERLPHWEAVLPPALGADGWARPWCHRCSKPVGEVKRVPLRDGRTAVTVLCHGQWQAVVATREEMGRIAEWAVAFGPGQPGLLQLSDAVAEPSGIPGRLPPPGAGE